MRRSDTPTREVLNKESTATRGLSVWLVNQYALRADQPGITRHATLARLMSSMLGIRTTIFASGTHYWNLENQTGDKLVTSNEHEPQFVYIDTVPVASNGAARVFSMLSFSGRIMLKALTPRVAQAPRPDVVVGSSPHPFAALAAWILAKRYRVPFVLEVRDLWPKTLVALMDINPGHPLVRALEVLERFLYQRATVIITLLPGSEQHIRKTSPGAGPVIWVPNGVDVSAWPRYEPSRDVEQFVVMYAGALGIPNSVDTILDAAALLQRRPQASRVSFVIVGDGKEKENLIARAKSLDLRNIEFRPAVPKTEVPRLLAGADLLVLTLANTKLYQYGISPNKLFDYMVSGHPVIMAVDTPVNPLEQARAGLTVPPEDPDALAANILKLSQMSLEELVGMGERGRAFVEDHHDMRDLARRFGQALTESRSRRVKRSV